jgi:predicted transposase YbfD/YdcC
MPSHDLLAHLSLVADPRIDRNKRHNLAEMLFVAVCATISGAEGWADIVEFAENRIDWLRRFVRLENGIPVDDTFARVLSRLTPKALNDCFLGWLEALRDESTGRFIAIDGKTLRRSHDRKRGLGPLHLVRAWATEQGLALGCVRTDEKSNEITAIPELLRQLELRGAIVTMDAMGCQTGIAAQIQAQQGDYVLAVKDNQPQLHEAICSFMADAEQEDFAHVVHGYHESTDSGHGRVERRRCWAFAQLDCLPQPERWAGLASFAVVECERHQGAKRSIERRCFISSLAPDAAQIARAVRAHWDIENGFHWVLDMTFREDDSRIRRGNGAENFAALRALAVSLLKQEPTKVSIRKKRIRAALNDAFRMQVLEAARR